MKITMNTGTIVSTKSNITIVNERIIGRKSSSAKVQKIDEIKYMSAENISVIKVDSNLGDVSITACNRANIETHCYGAICTDGKIKFNITTSGNEIKISAKTSGSIFNGDLKLNVLIPQKVFKLISVKSQTGSVELSSNIETEKLKIHSQNGSIETESSFNNISAKSINGNIDISVHAKNDIGISASSTNGNVNVELENIGSCQISTSSMNGSNKNKYNSTGKYKATGHVSSMNGNVRIR